MKINLCRIDDRLIHGQVATVWAKEANAERIIVCSDEVAKDDIRRHCFYRWGLRESKSALSISPKQFVFTTILNMKMILCFYYLHVRRMY